MYAMVTGMHFVATGGSKCALVIGSDTNSRVTNPEDKRTYPLFGDGAGAVLITAGDDEQALLSYTLGSDGKGTELLYRPAGGAKQPFDGSQQDPTSWYMCMDGRPVFKWAVRLLEESSNQILQAAECQHEDVRLWLFHQANVRILEAAIESMGLDRSRVLINLDRYGNTSTGSIPIALDEALKKGEVHPGDLLLMCGFGGGLSWGTALMRW